ncbi:MAG: class I SAM-dependent methyltransferase [Bacteroidetes bacterium]|nr:class I SAM-dependent methyltransferase [Bacteroidota bacterium]
MLSRIFRAILEVSPGIKRSLWKWWYQRLANRGHDIGWTFMNYGYSPMDGTHTIELEKEDEDNRLFIQLYHYAASEVPAENAKVLEVGSGRGGGASFVARYHGPSEMIGLDFSSSAIDLSRKMHGDIANLSFVHGDAESLPFEAETFDAVINVESSHCYGNMNTFVKEVARVLKPGGLFSWVDLRHDALISDLEIAFDHPQLRMIKDKIITENVIHALDEIHERKMAWIRENVPNWIRSPVKDFTGVKGSKIYNSFKDGSAVYLAKAYQKT